MRNSTWHRTEVTLWELFFKNLAIYFLTKLHIIYIYIYIYLHIYIYIYICVYIDICQSEIQQIQDHKNLIPPIRFQITQCITPNPKGHLSSHLQGRGVVDHDGIPHLQPWSKFQHPTQLFNPPSRSHLDDFHHEIQTVGLFWDSSFTPVKISLPWRLSSFVKQKSESVFHRGRHSSLNFVSKPPVGATDSVQGLMWQ